MQDHTPTWKNHWGVKNVANHGKGTWKGNMQQKVLACPKLVLRNQLPKIATLTCVCLPSESNSGHLNVTVTSFKERHTWRLIKCVCVSYESEVKWKWSRSVVSESVWPHRRQPIRLPHPWDSLGKNTGVGCHFLLLFLKSINKIQLPFFSRECTL